MNHHNTLHHQKDEINITDNRNNSISFSRVNEKLFMTDNLTNMDQIELPIVALCETIKNKYYDFKYASNIYITVKYNSMWTGSISISNTPTSTTSYASNYYFILETTLKEVENLCNQQEDSNDYVYVECILRANDTQMELFPASIPTTCVVSKMLSIVDTSKKYIKWLIPMIIGQGLVAIFSYITQGDPNYHVSMLSSLVFNKIATSLAE